ncbi:DegV family protein [Urinicoccus massiliensis]|uniref:DegV family protein n=1 Tax=Urinicoccus massiliensis TaxID=1723382 RepID=UPI0009309BA4|nr:DegV family protein [Urinicoccus massiliensis]
MSKLGLIIDTACDVPKEAYQKLNMAMLPLWVHFSDKSYRDLIDIEKDEFYDLLDKELPRTSIPSPTEVKEAIDKEFASGADEVLIITVSSGLSGVNNLSNLAANDYGGKVKVFDTKNVAIGAGFYGYRAASLRDEGHSADEIIKIMTDDRDNMRSKTYFAIPELDHLIKGGRIGKVQGAIGQILNIKPIITCNMDGIYYAIDKVRGFAKAQKKLIERVKKELSGTKDYYLSICHGSNPEALMLAKEALKGEVDRAKIYVEEQIAPTLATHTGRGLLGIAYYKL